MATAQKLCIAMGASGASTEILSPALWTREYIMTADVGRVFQVPPGQGFTVVKFAVIPYCDYAVAWGATNAATVTWAVADITNGDGKEPNPSARFLIDGQTTITDFGVITNQNCTLFVSFYTGPQMKLL